MPEDIAIKFDTSFYMATGKSRHDTTWKTKVWTWGEFVRKASKTIRTDERLDVYMHEKKIRQDEIKDKGGFVGGILNGGRRLRGKVTSRRILTLDIDFGKPDTWAMFCMLYNCAALVYSTHKHTPEKPRLRLCILLDRDVTVDEYEAIGRKVAETIDIDQFDRTTFQAERMMYWPSTAADAEFYFRYIDAPALCADEVLASYRDWKDTSSWPRPADELKDIKLSIDKAKTQEDPLAKTGIIGAFCRTYTIEEAIDKFLPDIYLPCDVPGRYTYALGTTAGGVVLYDNVFSYSHHSTDPACGMLCNAFDLVRVEKFGHLDADVKDKTNITKRPSFIAMEEFALKDRDTVSLMTRERIASACGDFANVVTDMEEPDDNWLDMLEPARKGGFLATYENIRLIISNEPLLKGCFAYDTFNERPVFRRLPPWRRKGDSERFIRDDDEANLRIFLSREPWRIEGRGKIEDAMDAVCRDNAFHPVKEYLDELTWDGVPRLDTLFGDDLGAPDTELNRWITRLAFTAAVYRAFEPGTKFDQITVIVGTQGCGKSTLLEKMAVNLEWFSSSMPSPDEPVKAASHLRGKFIIEIGELVGFRKAEVEAIKNFLSKTSDDFRPAYGKNEVHRLRQNIFFATTNEDEFLRDVTGERRYWPIQVSMNKPKYNLWADLTSDVVGQIWAEAVTHYRNRIPLVLPPSLCADLLTIQNDYKVKDEWQGLIESFLEKKLPTNWYGMTPKQRRSYFANEDMLSAEGVLVRTSVCAKEILNECVDLGVVNTSDKGNSYRVSSCMKKIDGWRRNKLLSDVGYGRQRVWTRENVNDTKDSTSMDVFV